MDGCGKSVRAKNHNISQVSGFAVKTNPEVPLLGRLNLKSQEKFKLSDYGTVHTDGSSSEGFCDTDRHESTKGQQDSDSDLGGDIGDAAAEKSRKFDSSDVNDTLLNIGLLNSRKSGKGLTQSISNNDDEGLPGESGYHGSSMSKNSASGSAPILNLPAHVKVMKADDVDLDSPLVTAVTGASGVNRPGKKSSGSKESAANNVVTNQDGNKEASGMRKYSTMIYKQEVKFLPFVLTD